MKRAIFSNSKQCNHSKKDCVCGSHSAKDIKKNTNHNSTKKRLQYRTSKKHAIKNAIDETEWDINPIFLGHLIR